MNLPKNDKAVPSPFHIFSDWRNFTIKVLPFSPFVLILIAFVLRILGVDWDQGALYHPDERSIYMRAELMHRTLTADPGWQFSANMDFPLDKAGMPGIPTFFDSSQSPLNPHWFPLGTIIIYLLVVIRFLLEFFMDQVRIQDLAIAGRILTSLISAVSVLLIYLLGKRLFGLPVGLLAAVLLTFCAFEIQLSNFYRPEPFVSALALVSFWYMLNIIGRTHLRDHILLGIFLGLSFSFRSTSLPLIFPVALTYFLAASNQKDQGLKWFNSTFKSSLFKLGLIAASTAFITFAILQPYALLDFGQFLSDQAFEGRVARTAGLVPYTIQYIGSQNVIYEIRQSSVWALGIPLGIAAWLGLLLSLIRVGLIKKFKTARSGEILLLFWVIPLLTTLIFFEVKFLRYLAPIIPILILFGSRWIIASIRFSRLFSKPLSKIAIIMMIMVIGSTAFWGMAFATTYNNPHPAISASAWINENLESGSKILLDNHWDEGFKDLGDFSLSQLRIYERDTIDKLSEISKQTSSADYLLAYSNRPSGSISRIPERYPLSSAFYKLLFDGQLGFTPIQAFERYPNFLGFEFAHDPYSESGLKTLDRLPGINSSSLSWNLGYADENIVNYDRPLVVVWKNEARYSQNFIIDLILENRAQPKSEPFILNQERISISDTSGSWTQIFKSSFINTKLPWLAWLGLVQLIYLISLPFSFFIFRWLPDRGLILARPLGLLVIAWITWVGSSYGLWDFSSGNIWILILILSAISFVLTWCNRLKILAFIRQNLRYLVTAELIFLTAFFVFLIIRAANPDLWHPYRGGEKPMDLSYLTAVVRSHAFPPYDPWYAGGFINYYYFGFVIIGVLIKSLGILPAVSYNLAIPLLFALAFSSIFSVGYNLSLALKPSKLKLGRVPLPVLAGLSTACLALVFGNMDGGVQLVQAIARLLTGDEFGNFDYWRSSRLMPGQISITEFPFWTFLFADLHAHLISIPFAILTIGLSLNLVLSANKNTTGFDAFLGILPLGFSVGALAAINTWDIPVYAILAISAITIALICNKNFSPFTTTTLVFAGIIFLIFIAYFSWLPFHQNYDAPFSGLHLSKWRTVLWHYVAIHALLIFLSISWLIYESKSKLCYSKSALIFFLTGSFLTIGAFSIVGFLREWITALLLLIAISLVLSLTVLWARRKYLPEAPVKLILLSMLGIALTVGFGVDILTIDNDIDRMNTVFKFYLNSWVLFSIIGGVTAWHLISVQAFNGKKMLLAWLGCISILVLFASVFPVLGTRARIADRFAITPLTLDGTKYQSQAIYHDPGPKNDGVTPNSIYPLLDDAEALQFLREEIIGAPVVLEGVTTQYRWTPRVAVYTGLPVVVGWEWHQLQQRGEAGASPSWVRGRIMDVKTMYSTNSHERLVSLLKEYNVSYIYVGPTERLYFPWEGIAKFDAMVDSELDLVFKNNSVKIYRYQGQ